MNDVFHVLWHADDAPVNMFEFLRPFVIGLGGQPPSDTRLPVWLVYGVAWASEMVWHAVHRLWEFEPVLSRCEVQKIGECWDLDWTGSRPSIAL